MAPITTFIQRSVGGAVTMEHVATNSKDQRKVARPEQAATQATSIWYYFPAILTQHTCPLCKIKKRSICPTVGAQIPTVAPAIVIKGQKVENVSQRLVSASSRMSHPLIPNLILTCRITTIFTTTIWKKTDPRWYAWWTIASATYWDLTPFA